MSTFPTIPCRTTYNSSTEDTTQCEPFPTIPCRATVALQEMLHSVCVSYYSLYGCSGSTRDATQCVRFRLFPADLPARSGTTQRDAVKFRRVPPGYPTVFGHYLSKDKNNHRNKGNILTSYLRRRAPLFL